MSTRDALRTFKPKVHSFEHGGQTLFVKALSGAGRAKFMELCKDGAPKMGKVVALGLCDEDGTLVYSVENTKDVEEIDAIDGAALQAIVFKLYEISGLTAKAIEEAEKNS